MSFTFFDLGGGAAAAETVDLIAGETIAAGQLVYQSHGATGTQGRVYLTDRDDEWTSNAAAVIGIATTGASAGATVTVQYTGVVSGLSGLTAGLVYSPSSTPGELAANGEEPLIGIAESTTELRLTGTHTTTGLTAGVAYGANGSGVLTAGQNESIGYAISSTELHIRSEFGATKPQDSLWPAPLVYYRFATDPGSATAEDSSGNGYDGTLTAGSYSYTTSTVGTSRTVIDITPTTGNGLVLPTLASPSGTDFTWSFWVNPDTITSLEYVITQRTTASSSLTNARYCRWSSSKLQCVSGGSLSSATSAATGSWQHWVWTMNATTGTIYRNGVSDATTTQTARTRENTDTSVFGIYNDTNTTYQFEGLACEIAYWDVALTADEVSRIYGGGTPPALV